MASWELDLGWRGLFKLLFRRKKCGTCGARLVRRTESRRADSDWDVRSTGTGFGAEWHGERHIRRFVYDCPQCETTTPLEDL
jgi:hypothetical protein